MPGNQVVTVGAVEVGEAYRDQTAPRPSAFIPAPERGSFETVIAGGGPAGMTCALYLLRKKVNTLLITPELGGQVTWTSEIENYPGYNVISGIDLAMKYREQLEKYPLALRSGDHVSAMELIGQGGIVRTARGAEYEFKALVIATGKKAARLGVPGEDRLYGHGVTYCATCDGPLFRGERVAVIGGGNSALSASLDLLRIGCTVHIINNVPGFQADPVMLDKAAGYTTAIFHDNYQVVEISGEREVEGITIRSRGNGRTELIPVKGVFVEIGLEPNSDFARGIVETNAASEIMVDCRCRTDMPGVFAAGDVTNAPNKQIVIAAGEGAKAALTVSDYLKKLA